jgi:tetratricopeptide (TPR) repeat protein
MDVTWLHNVGVPEPGTTAQTIPQVASQGDPMALLDFAWAMEPPLRLTERRAALDRLDELLATGQVTPSPDGRDWQLELWAERALDAAAAEQVEEALELAGRVLAGADGSAPIATARATLARGRALAWSGTEESTHAGEGLLIEAAERCGALGQLEWQGVALFWRGHAICYENGRLLEAEQLMSQALETLPYSSPRRATVLDSYADVLVDLGAWDRADEALNESYRLAEIADDAKSRAYATWSRAHTAAGRGDSVRAERLFREVERDATDWWQNHGAYFLCDAARTLDTLGLTDQARGYLRRARALLETSESGPGQTAEDFEPLALARALILARSGDPGLALEELQALTRRRWLEKRLLWRFMLLGAWATLRAGNRESAASEAARAFETAVAAGGLVVALAGEPDIAPALAPLAAEAGNAAAGELLAGDAQLVIRLFGAPQVSSADGVTLELPAGRPGELVRMLALHPHGLPVEVVLEEFFPGVAPKTSRHRLRQVLTRLRASAGEIVVRDGEMLTLAPAWVDVREFRVLARRARASRGTRGLILSVAARALADRGPLLVSDPYAPWAEEVRAGVAADLDQLERDRQV